MSSLNSDQQGVLTRCPSCGRTNRLRFQTVDRPTRCGSCHQMLSPPSQPIEAAGAAVFDALVSQAAVPVIVDFWAPWCGPCRMMAPELETVARTTAGAALVVKVNTDAVPELGERFRILSIPTLAFFRDGREVSRVSGARPAAEIQSLLSRV